MSGEDKTTKKTTKKSNPKPVEKKEAPVLYESGEVSMLSSQITTEEAFYKMWKGNLKREDIRVAWKKARKWKDQFE